MKKLLASLSEKLKNILLKKSDSEPQTRVSEVFQSSAAANAAQAPIRNKKLEKPIAEKYYPYALAVATGFLIANLIILFIRPMMLPTQAPPSVAQRPKTPSVKLRTDYNVITDRNIFNSDGVIPPPLLKESGEGENIDNSLATLSTLPLTLIGTIVHINPAKSVAAIQSKSGNTVIPYLPNDEIEGIAILIKVERGKAIFRNNRSGKLEYIEIPNESKLTFNVNKPVTTATGVQKKSPTEFTLRREDLNKHLKNLPELLQQARAVPNQIPGTNEIDGFRLLEIQPNTIFTDLGLVVNDVIKDVNGSKVTSPARAMELYNQLKNEGRFEITVNRDGQDVTFTYSVTE